MHHSAQLVIIGAGPGGYTAAFHAADLGLKVTLIDSGATLGGVCLNRGCIPSKALLHAAHTLSDAAHAKVMGIEFGTPQVDINKLRAWKDGVVAKLTGGLSSLAKARNVTYIQGNARFLNNTTLEIRKADGTMDTLAFDHALIATGSRPVELSFMPKSTHVWDSTAALALPSIPASLLVIGGGYIGLELGSAYAALGSAVSVVEALPVILGSADKDLADILIRKLKKTFTTIMAATQVIAAEETSDGLRVHFKDAAGKEWQETYSNALVSTGRRPNTETLSLENTKVERTEKGFIEVTAERRTDEKNIYAIGDVTGNPMLAHKASREAKVAIDAILKKPTAFEPTCIPSVIFTDPELAWCGLTEMAARAQDLDIAVSKFPWAASGRALTLNRTDGLTKIIADTKTGKILGIGMVGVHAGELIAAAALAIESGMKADDLALTIHPHPTLSETLMESAEGLFGHPTHLIKK
ncbi:MAG: dihydrolipoyl dehydrogenase [Candidatus Omnitrophica bacterium]|nr:dihydrolipoyl dehydrogenase [Candidatus Omnitrophota bacterium]